MISIEEEVAELCGEYSMEKEIDSYQIREILNDFLGNPFKKRPRHFCKTLLVYRFYSRDCTASSSYRNKCEVKFVSQQKEITENYE